MTTYSIWKWSYVNISLYNIYIYLYIYIYDYICYYTIDDYSLHAVDSLEAYLCFHTQDLHRVPNSSSKCIAAVVLFDDVWCIRIPYSYYEHVHASGWCFTLSFQWFLRFDSPRSGSSHPYITRRQQSFHARTTSSCSWPPPLGDCCSAAFSP